jgi:HEPN domain-containing protein
LFNIAKQIEYWKSGALSDIETAEILIDKGKYIHGLFFCNLVIEKALKAHYVKTIENFAPKTHDLIYLANKANLILDKDRNLILVMLMKYQLEGRYPDNNISSPGEEKANEYFHQTKELLEWLIQKL